MSPSRGLGRGTGLAAYITGALGFHGDRRTCRRLTPRSTGRSNFLSHGLRSGGSRELFLLPGTLFAAGLLRLPGLYATDTNFRGNRFVHLRHTFRFFGTSLDGRALCRDVCRLFRLCQLTLRRFRK